MAQMKSQTCFDCHMANIMVGWPGRSSSRLGELWANLLLWELGCVQHSASIFVRICKREPVCIFMDPGVQWWIAFSLADMQHDVSEAASLKQRRTQSQTDLQPLDTWRQWNSDGTRGHKKKNCQLESSLLDHRQVSSVSSVIQDMLMAIHYTAKGQITPILSKAQS